MIPLAYRARVLVVAFCLLTLWFSVRAMIHTLALAAAVPKLAQTQTDRVVVEAIDRSLVKSDKSTELARIIDLHSFERVMTSQLSMYSSHHLPIVGMSAAMILCVLIFPGALGMKLHKR